MKEIILVVEDDDFLREGIREILEYAGFMVFTARHGQEALHQMSLVRPDLILSDIAMPIMDGLMFFEAVRKQDDWITIPFIFLTARGDPDDILTGKDLGAEDYLTKPIESKTLIASIRGRLARSHQLRLAQIRQSYETTLTVLANAIEVRDQYTRGHVERVMGYALAIAQQLPQNQSLSDNYALLEQVRFGAILHDIGKIHVPESILCKKGPLTDEEWAEIKRHPVTGAEMLKGIPYLAPAIPVIRHHHERWDGQGYPDRLAGEAIPLAARIVTIADAFDAMTTNRSYRQALPPPGSV